MDPPALEDSSEPRNPESNATEGNTRRNSSQNGRRISQMLDRINGRRSSQESTTQPNNVDPGRRPSQQSETGNNGDNDGRASQRNSSIVQGPGNMDSIQGNNADVARNSIRSTRELNQSSTPEETSTPSQRTPDETRRLSGEFNENRSLSGVNGGSEDTRRNSGMSGDQRRSSRRISQESTESNTEVAQRRRSITDNGRRTSFQDTTRLGNGTRPSQQELEDFSQAASLISDLVERVSLSNEVNNTQGTNRKEERRESLKKTMEETSTKAERRESLKKSADTSSPTKKLEISERGEGEYSGRRSSRRQWGSTRDLSRGSSTAEVDSEVDDIEAEYIKDVMKKRRSIQENQTRDMREAQQGLLAASGASDFHARLLALRLAVQDYELPMQLAYDELDELAANAERVKNAIEKNMTLLTIQMRRSSLRYMRSAFTAWTFYTQQKMRRRLAMTNAMEYSQRRMLGRAFQAWRMFFLRMQKFKRLQLSAEKFLRRHYLARIWRAWASLVRKRLREDERHRREKQLVRDLQVKQRECVGRRAVNAIRRRRLQRVFFAFKVGIEISREIGARRDHIFYILIRRKAALAFKFWQRYPSRRAREMRAIQRRKRKNLLKCFWHWDDETQYAKYRKKRMAKSRLGNAFAKWIRFLVQKRRYDTIFLRVKRARLRRHFNDFHENILEEKWKKRTCKRIMKKCEFIRLKWSFQAWIWYMQHQAHKRMIKIEDYVAILEKENIRTRTECDRLGRIIDTGEWDQQRVMELEQASQVLSGERDALTKLVGRLEREHQLALDYQNQQEQEIKLLKDQMLDNNFVHRNKLLVKGASSFNSVVRAVKSEVLKRGVNPEIVYSIDKLAMDQVSVFPDGDLRVKPLNKFDKGKWMHRASTDSTKAFMEDPKVPLIQ